MVYIKKSIILLLSLIVAFFIVNFIFNKVIGYPTYGVKEKMKGIRGSGVAANIYYPHSEYWSVEGGNKVFKRNNLGLTGCDIEVNDSKKYIFVLGSSLTEAVQVAGEYNHTSVFKNKLNENHLYDFEVLNLGMQGFNIYDSYNYLRYNSRLYKPYKIILIVDGIVSGSAFANNIDFNNDPFIYPDNSIKTKLYLFFRNYLSIVNIYSYYLSYLKHRDEGSGEKEIKNVHKEILDTLSLDIFKKSLIKIMDINQNLMVVSIGPLIFEYKYISEFCADNNIEFYGYEELMKTPDNLLQTDGHLNNNGNKLLGEFLYEKFINSERKFKHEIIY